ncbi:MAG: Grx4 family monothiol glutaredoxin [Gallionellaceae bacterium]|jgi:monothiol glutaredoxin
MDTQEIIRQQVTTHRVVLYMKGTPQFPQCGFSGNVARILKAAGVSDYLAVNLLENPELVPGLREYANWPTTPLLFIDGEFIGGSDIATEMFQNGELQALLLPKS